MTANSNRPRCSFCKHGRHYRCSSVKITAQEGARRIEVEERCNCRHDSHRRKEVILLAVSN